jgi:hypothetical protein
MLFFMFIQLAHISFIIDLKFCKLRPPCFLRGQRQPLVICQQLLSFLELHGNEILSTIVTSTKLKIASNPLYTARCHALLRLYLAPATLIPCIRPSSSTARLPLCPVFLLYCSIWPLSFTTHPLSIHAQFSEQRRKIWLIVLRALHVLRPTRHHLHRSIPIALALVIQIPA